MKRLSALVIGAWLIALTGLSFAQSPGPSISQDGMILQNNVSSAVNGTPINVGGYAIITYQVTALSGTATIVPESSLDASNYNGLTCYALDGTTTVTSFSGTGTWRCNVTGQNWARARISSCVACTVSVQATKWVSGQISKAPNHIPVTVPEGGTGDTTLTSGAYLKGAGNSPVTAQAIPIPCTDGGTGLTSGTSGGVLAYTATCTLASSSALIVNALVVGGGAGAAPSTLAVTDDTVPVNNGSIVQLKTVPDCQDSSGNHLNYTQSSNTFSCGTTSGASVVRSYLAGLTLSTTLSSNTMTIAAGVASDSTNAVMMTLAASLNKTTGAWAVGSNQGCLDTGSIANSTWYSFYEIERTDLTVVDGLCSLSATAPTMPANYTYKRRIGSGLVDGSGHWTLFTQDGDYFRWAASVRDVNTTNPGTSAVLATLTIPSGVNVYWIGSAGVTTSGAVSDDLYLSDPSANDEAPTNQGNPPGSMLGHIAVSTTQSGYFYGIRSNTSSQVRYRLLSSDASTSISIYTYGWLDRRGKDN